MTATPTPTVDKTYHLLAPLPCDPSTDGPSCTSKGLETFDPTQANNLGGYLNLMIKIIIGICAVLAMVMIVMGGIEWMTSELPGNKEHGKERIQGAVFGLVLALCAWTLLYTINPSLLVSDLSSLKDATVTVVLKTEDVAQGCTNGTCVGQKQGADWASIAGSKATPVPYVTTNNPECVKVGDQNCTSTFGLDTSALQATQWGCKCNLVVTGGTESGLHSATTSHKPGSATIDLRVSTDLDNYIMKNGTPGTNNGDSIYTIGGVNYFNEGDHWHVYK